MGCMRLFRNAMVVSLAPIALCAQIIEFDSGGLRYKTLTRNGVTVMFAHLPNHVRDYTILQVAVSNGSQIPWMVKTGDFRFEKGESAALVPEIPRNVVTELIEKAGRADVIKLVATYESALYGMARMNVTNGYEQRRQAAWLQYNSSRLKAAAAASAIAFVDARLTPGQSTDGALFFHNAGKPFDHGKLVVKVAAETFVFPVENHLP